MVAGSHTRLALLPFPPTHNRNSRNAKKGKVEKWLTDTTFSFTEMLLKNRKILKLITTGLKVYILV